MLSKHLGESQNVVAYDKCLLKTGEPTLTRLFKGSLYMTFLVYRWLLKGERNLKRYCALK